MKVTSYFGWMVAAALIAGSVAFADGRYQLQVTGTRVLDQGQIGQQVQITPRMFIERKDKINLAGTLIPPFPTDPQTGQPIPVEGLNVDLTATVVSGPDNLQFAEIYDRDGDGEQDNPSLLLFAPKYATDAQGQLAPVRVKIEPKGVRIRPMTLDIFVQPIPFRGFTPKAAETVINAAFAALLFRATVDPNAVTAFYGTIMNHPNTFDGWKSLIHICVYSDEARVNGYYAKPPTDIVVNMFKGLLMRDVSPSDPGIQGFVNTIARAGANMPAKLAAVEQVADQIGTSTEFIDKQIGEYSKE
jgi:hypothetical protein